MTLAFTAYDDTIHAAQYDGVNTTDVRAYIDATPGAGPTFMVGTIIGNFVAAVHVTDWVVVRTLSGFEVFSDADFQVFFEDRWLGGYTPPAFTETAATRPINGTAFQPSATRNMDVSYSVDIAATLSLVTGQSGTVLLEISANGSTGWTERARFTNTNTGSLTIGLNLTQTVTGTLHATIPAGWFVRLTASGTATATYRSGQEAVTV